MSVDFDTPSAVTTTSLTPQVGNAGGFSAAQADAVANLAHTMLLSDGTRLESGKVSWAGHGLTVRTVYYLSQGTAGAYTTVMPVSGLVQVLFFVEDADTIHIDIESQSTGATGGIDDVLAVGQVVTTYRAIDFGGFNTSMDNADSYTINSEQIALNANNTINLAAQGGVNITTTNSFIYIGTLGTGDLYLQAGLGGGDVDINATGGGDIMLRTAAGGNVNMTNATNGALVLPNGNSPVADVVAPLNGALVFDNAAQQVLLHSNNTWAPLVGPQNVAAHGLTVLNQQVLNGAAVDIANGDYAIPFAGTFRLRYDIATDGSGGAITTSHFFITDSANNIIDGSSRTRGGGSTTLEMLAAEVTVVTTGPATYKLRGSNGGAGTVTLVNTGVNDSTLSWLQIGAVAVSSMVGATTLASGAGGFVPAPPINPTPGSKLLLDNGTWGDAPSTAIPNLIIFGGSGTYTPTVGMKYVEVEVQGAGGGSGGCRVTTAGLASMGGAGGGGGYGKVRLTAAQVGASQTVTVGAGGAAGGSTTAGGVGGTSSFGTFVTCGGGGGGVASAAAAAIPVIASAVAGGATTVAGAAASRAVSGEIGEAGSATTIVAGGASGGSAMGSRISGRSALSSLAATAATVAINGYGVGAVGAANLNLNNAVRLGSAGSQGAVIIHEYF